MKINLSCFILFFQNTNQNNEAGVNNNGLVLDIQIELHQQENCISRSFSFQLLYLSISIVSTLLMHIYSIHFNEIKKKRTKQFMDKLDKQLTMTMTQFIFIRLSLTIFFCTSKSIAVMYKSVVI